MPLPPPAPLAPSCTPPQAPYAAWQQLGLSLGCLVQLGAAGTDPSSGQSSGAAAGPTASSAGGGSMVIPRNPPPPFPLSPGSRGNLFHAGSR